MEKADIKLKAPMIALEKIVPAAKLAPLADYKCSVCALHTALAGSEAGLGEDRGDAALGYVGGGAALSKTDLASPTPAAPAPGTILVPMAI
eukprot:9236419-Pyramimonas_sp.AAC.1